MDYEETQDDMVNSAWVVFEVLNVANNRSGAVWAWCRPKMDVPGFEEVHYTDTSGLPTDGPEVPRFGPVIFKVFC